MAGSLCASAPVSLRSTKKPPNSPYCCCAFTASRGRFRLSKWTPCPQQIFFALRESTSRLGCVGCVVVAVLPDVTDVRGVLAPFVSCFLLAAAETKVIVLIANATDNPNAHALVSKSSFFLSSIIIPFFIDSADDKPVLFLPDNAKKDLHHS